MWGPVLWRKSCTSWYIVILSWFLSDYGASTIPSGAAFCPSTISALEIICNLGFLRGTQSLQSHVLDISRASSPYTSMDLQRSVSRCRSLHHGAHQCPPCSSPFACHSTGRHHSERLCSIAAHWPLPELQSTTARWGHLIVNFMKLWN